MDEEQKVEIDKVDVASEISQTGGRVIAFLSSKGGTGKTTLAVTLGKQLSAERRVLLVDLDFATAGLSLFLRGRGLHHFASSECVLDVLKDFDTHGELPSINPKKLGANENLYYLAAVRSASPLVGQDREVSDDFRFASLPFGDPLRFRKALRQLFSFLLDGATPKFDYVIIDTRGGLEEVSLIPGFLADYSILVLDSSPLAWLQVTHCITRMISLADRVGLPRRDPEVLGINGVVINKSDSSADEKAIRNTIEPGIGKPLLGLIPFDHQVMFSAQEFEVPFNQTNSEFSVVSARVFAGMFGRPGLESDSLPLRSLLKKLQNARRWKSALSVSATLIAVLAVVGLSLLSFWSLVSPDQFRQYLHVWRPEVVNFGFSFVLVTTAFALFRWKLFDSLIVPQYRRLVKISVVVLSVVALIRVGGQVLSMLDQAVANNRANHDRATEYDKIRRSLVGQDGSLVVTEIDLLIEGCSRRDIAIKVPPINPEGKYGEFQLRQRVATEAKASIASSVSDDSGNFAILRLRLQGGGEKTPAGRCNGPAERLVLEVIRNRKTVNQ